MEPTQKKLGKFGIEHEFFIFNEDMRVPSLIQLDSVFRELRMRGYKTNPVTNDSLSAHMDIGSGFLAIKNDFCTHILEIAFPPLHSSEVFKKLFENTLSDIDNALSSVGLIRKHESFLPEVPTDIIFMPCARGKWMHERKVPPGINSHRYLTSVLVSTQVHIESKFEESVQKLSRMYACEFLAPLLFSESKTSSYECLRPIVWQESFPEEYLLFGFPQSIPKTLEEYQKSIKNSVDFRRDYSLIVPREIGTLEFRSICSQRSSEKILQAVALRYAQTQLVASDETLLKKLNPDPRALFLSVCKNGRESLSAKTVTEVTELLHSRSIGEWKSLVEDIYLRRFHANRTAA